MCVYALNTYTRTRCERIEKAEPYVLICRNSYISKREEGILYAYTVGAPAKREEKEKTNSEIYILK